MYSRIKRHLRSQLLMLTAFSFLFYGSVMASGITLENMPPVVIASEPVSGADLVSPSVTKLKITFSKPMGLKGYSFNQDLAMGAFPNITGQPSFSSDGLVCTLPVQLLPDTLYVIWINRGQTKNFKDASGFRSALPWLLTFQTSSTAKKAERAPSRGVL